MPIIFLALLLLFSQTQALAQACSVKEKLCIMEQAEGIIANIDNDSWRDKAYRELAKSYTYEGQPDKAIALIPKIQNADTKAMTIRGIGFAAADRSWQRHKYNDLFQKLDKAAQTIDHPPSHAIAYTYISMAQAFAKDDEGAMKTAASIENNALRHKAFGETAEIQAERGDFKAAMDSIVEIDSLAFRNKSYRLVSKIFTKQGRLQEAYEAAMKINNPYTQAQSLQTILNYGNPEEEY